MNVPSQVEYLSSHEGYSCGYCKSPNTNYSHGMWAHILKVEDYQNLIDRGWRRSGMYCYKPTMTRTCCPMYTIKCEATKLKLSKSQKKILKRMNKFLRDGMQENKKEGSAIEEESTCETENSSFNEAILLENALDKYKMSETRITNIDISLPSKNTVENIQPSASGKPSSNQEVPDKDTCVLAEESNKKTHRSQTPRPGDGVDPSKPQCKKAKILRLERKQKKVKQKECAMEVSKSNNQPKEKSLEDFIKESSKGSAINTLELRLVNSSPPSAEFEASFEESYLLYAKYQMVIHKDSPSMCTKKGYTRFLIRSPLQPFKDDEGPPSGYGSFHQQYWLNGKLIAVGVIDILPKCASSVYFFYDPDYSFLSLGTYGSLRELELVRSYAQRSPDLKFYYMGFYIHTCPKMAYKARISPSFLLCPEVYTWHPVEQCITKLNISKYSRLNDNKKAICLDSIISTSHVRILWNFTAMRYGDYRGVSRNKDENEVAEYADLVGKHSSENILLIRQ